MPPELLTAFAFNLGLRTLPIALFAAVGRHSRRRSYRVALPALSLALLATAGAISGTTAELGATMAIACLYFLGASLVAHGLRGRRVREALPAPVILGLCLSLFLVLPAWVFKRSVLVPVVVVGFDYALSAYSYVVTKPEQERTWHTSLFFVLVDPVVAYRQRSVAIQRSSPRPGLARCFGGLLSLLAAELLLHIIPPTIPSETFGSNLFANYPLADYLLLDYLEFLIGVCPWLALHYLGVAGAASLQIGLLGLLGFRVAERFRRPFLASDPADFWQRYNRYVTDWLKYHVFAPVAGSRLVRSAGGRQGSAWWAGVAAAFGLNGLLHVLCAGLLFDRLDIRPLVAFLAYALVLLAADLFKRLAPSPRKGVVPQTAASLATFHVIVAFGGYLLPAMGGL